MELDVSCVDSIIRGARLKTSFTEYNYQNYIDRLVLPGMVLRLTGSSDLKSKWSVGPGLSLIPITQTQNKIDKRNLADCILVNQFGILKYKSTSTTATDQNNNNNNNNHENIKKQTQVQTISSQQNIIWLEFLLSVNSLNTLLPLSRFTLRSYVNQFSVGDKVIGIVLRKIGDNYMIDIGCSTSASLNYLSFKGASKKNRPDIYPGDVIYAMISRADQDLDIELSCVNEEGTASNMGILGRHEPGTVGNAGGMSGGILLHCTRHLVCRLSKVEEFPLLQYLSKIYPYEVTLGANGRIWLTGRSSRETMILANAIAIADHIPASECCKLAKELC